MHFMYSVKKTFIQLNWCDNQKWIKMTAAMLAVKRCTGVNLRNVLPAGEKAASWWIHPGLETQGRMSRKIQNRYSSSPHKKDLCPPEFKKQM